MRKYKFGEGHDWLKSDGVTEDLSYAYFSHCSEHRIIFVYEDDELVGLVDVGLMWEAWWMHAVNYNECPDIMNFFFKFLNEHIESNIKCS
jgi:hypothetical protein